LSHYTAFIAVSDEVRVNPNDRSVSVQVPVEMPEGISYQGIFGDVEVEATYEFEVIPSEPPDEFDITLISPNMMAEEEERWDMDEQRLDDAEYTMISEPAPAPLKTPDIEPDVTKAESKDNRLQIISATGLNKDAIARLTQHLQSIPLSPGVKGNLVFEFYISQGRVRQLILDQEASSVNDQDVTEAIGRSLLTWRPPHRNVDYVRLLVRIQPSDRFKLGAPLKQLLIKLAYWGGFGSAIASNLIPPSSGC
jgi:Ca-activated chloride channel family protein